MMMPISTRTASKDINKIIEYTISKKILTHFTGKGAVQVHSIGKVVHHLNFVVALQDL